VRFVYYGGQWYLELEPSYHFTIDGQRESLFAYDQLRKIKALEGAGAVRDALRMWAHLFAEGATLFRAPTLELAAPVELACERGIVDADWTRPKDEPEAGEPTLLEAA
jgi:hypothetical protein